MKKSNMFSNSINFLIRKTVKRIVLFFQAYIFLSLEINNLFLCDFKRWFAFVLFVFYFFLRNRFLSF